MRTATILLIVIAGSSFLQFGCAHKASCENITAAPSPEELPTFERRECPIAASIAVEGRKEQPRPGVVPDFKEPELTPEEKEALCIQPEPINWLEFYVPKPLVQRVSILDRGGPDVAAWGVGGDISAVGFARQPMTAGQELRPVSGVWPMARRVAEAGPARPANSAIGIGQGGASVATDRPRKVAEHEELCDP